MTSSEGMDTVSMVSDSEAIDIAREFVSPHVGDRSLVELAHYGEVSNPADLDRAIARNQKLTRLRPASEDRSLALESLGSLESWLWERYDVEHAQEIEESDDTE